MKLSIYYPVALLFIVAALHFVTNAIGLYDMQMQAGFVWVDNILHALVGTAFGLFWFWILHIRYPGASKTFGNVSAILFVLMMAIAWEIIELAFFIVFPAQALELKIYSPSLLEASMDIGSNIAGALVPVMFYRYLRVDS